MGEGDETGGTNPTTIPRQAGPASPDSAGTAGTAGARRPIVGDHPASGIRIALERPAGDAPPWRYEGHVFTPDARARLRVTVDAGGAVAVDLDAAAPGLDAGRDAGADARLDELPPGVGDKVKLLLRTAYKQAQQLGDEAREPGAPPEPPPRRLVRWRGEK